MEDITFFIVTYLFIISLQENLFVLESFFAFGKMCKEIPFQTFHRSKYPS